MGEEILKCARFLYFSNAAAISKYDCVKQVLYQSGLCDVKKLIEDLRPFDVSIGEYIEDLAKKI